MKEVELLNIRKILF